jgi:hypothetical protein
MKRILSILGGLAAFLAFGAVINAIPGVDDETPTPTPTPSVQPHRRGDYDPSAEQYDQNRDECANWFYC